MLKYACLSRNTYVRSLNGQLEVVLVYEVKCLGHVVGAFNVNLDGRREHGRVM